MKTIKVMFVGVLMALAGSSVRAADTLIEIVGTESKSFTSAKQVTANYYWRYFLQSQDPDQSGMSNYTDYVVCDSTNAAKNVRSSSAATKTATFTGKKFTPGYVRVWLQQRQGTSGGYDNVETFYAYVAQADAVSATVGGGNKTIATPTIAAAADWACQSAKPSVATATVNSGSATSRTVTITPVAAGTTTIDVRSGSSTYSTGNPLRQRITVTVTGGTPTPPTVDVTITNVVVVANGRNAVLTNDVGQAIAWSDCKSSASSDPDVAQVINADGLVAVGNTTKVGYTMVEVKTTATNYHFAVCSVVVGLEKTIKEDPNNTSNVMVRVTAHVDCVPPFSPTNNILFIGSCCSTHGCSADVVSSAINVLAQKGNVDWYLYGDPADSDLGKKHEQKGNVKFGGQISPSQVKMGGEHRQGHCPNLHSYLHCLDDNLVSTDGQRNYDFVILSFDAGMLALSYDKDLPSFAYDYETDNPALKQRVAEKFVWFYQNKRVIWLRPPVPEPGELQTMAYQVDENGNVVYYRPTNQNRVIAPAWVPDGLVSDAGWEALVAVLDPETFLANPSGQRYTAIDNNYEILTWADDEELYPTGEPVEIAAKAANPNELQVSYDDADKVAEYLDKYIQAASFEARIEDTIVNLNESLSVKGNRFYVWSGFTAPETQTNDTYKVIADLPTDAMHWKLLASSDSDSYAVSTNQTDLSGERWFKYEIDVVDNGTFLEECLKQVPPRATPTENPGEYLVNPNDGQAHLSLFATINGELKSIAAGDAALTTLWKREKTAQLVSLWITDHADAGTDKVHLQFEPTFDKPFAPLTDWANQVNEAGRFKVVWGRDPAEVQANIDKQVYAPAALRTGNATFPGADRRVWVTVEVPSDSENRRSCKIVVIPETAAPQN